MPSLEGGLLDFRSLDRLAAQDTPIHRLDPRAKLLVTVIFILAVVSFRTYELTALIPFCIFPAVMVMHSNLPVRYILKKILLVCPLALAVGLFNPLFDREVHMHLGSLAITGGWISFVSIMIRTVLTTASALVLIGVTGMPAICWALKRLGIPDAFAVQLLFLHRYIFVLAEEGVRASRARALRSIGKRGLGLPAYGSLLGHLLIRTWQRAERLQAAMLARGYAGEIHTRQEFTFGRKELYFLAGWSALFIAVRFLDASRNLGAFVTGMFL